MTTSALLAARPRIAAHVVLGPELTRGPAVIHLLKDGRDGRRMEVGPKEYFIIARLDGTRSLEEIGQAYAERFGARLGEAQWGQMLRLLHSRRLLDDGSAARAQGTATASASGSGTPAAAAPSPADPTGPADGTRRSTLLNGHTRLVADAPRLMDRLYAATPAVARRPSGLAVLGAAVLALLVGIGAHAGELVRQTARTVHQPVLLLAVGCVLWVSLAVHELAHGLLARACGGRVVEIGLRWRLMATYLYCEVADVRFFPHRRQQVATAAAGAVANLVFLLPWYPLWALLPQHAQARTPLGALLLLGTAMALLNLVPLPPLDGYKALCYGLGCVELATGSRAFVQLLGAAALRRGPGVAAYRTRLRLVYGGYALLCAALAVAFLAGCGPALRILLPERWAGAAPYVPLAVAAAALLLWALGLVGRRLHGRRRQDAAAGDSRAADGSGTAAATAVRPGAAPAPAHPPQGAARAAPPDDDAGTHPPQQRKGEMTATEDATPTEPVVVLDSVSKRYGEVQALDGVSLSVRRGEFFGILGPNGAGKTTLVEIVEGLRQADGGTVTVLGRTPWPRDIALLGRLGVQTQASAFFVRLTAGEHLQTVAALYGLPPEAAERALETVGLTEKRDTRVDALSGGQRQRLALASALVHEPELIFLDEPTAALDPEARRDLWSVLRSLRSAGRTIIYTTHYLDEAEALCDRVAIVARGSLVALDTPRNLIRALGAPARLLVPAADLTVEQARGLEGVDRVTTEGGERVLETATANRVLAALGDLVDIEAVQVRTATLEDAYLTLTGVEDHA